MARHISHHDPTPGRRRPFKAAAVQSRNAISAYFTSEQTLPFGFARHCRTTSWISCHTRTKRMYNYVHKGRMIHRVANSNNSIRSRGNLFSWSLSTAGRCCSGRAGSVSIFLLDLDSASAVMAVVAEVAIWTFRRPPRGPPCTPAHVLFTPGSAPWATVCPHTPVFAGKHGYLATYYKAGGAPGLGRVAGRPAIFSAGRGYRVSSGAVVTVVFSSRLQAEETAETVLQYLAYGTHRHITRQWLNDVCSRA